MSRTQFHAPRKTGNVVRDIDPGMRWYVERHAKARTYFAFWDSDISKWQVQQGADHHRLSG